MSLPDAAVSDISTFSDIIALVTQFTHPTIRGLTTATAIEAFNKLSGIQSCLASSLALVDERFAEQPEVERILQREKVRRSFEPHLVQAQTDFNDAFRRLSEMMAGTGYELCGRTETRLAAWVFKHDHRDMLKGLNAYPPRPSGV
jgi:hypothetical protein